MSVQQVRAALAKYPAIELTIVFGSIVRGQARTDSDIDVAVQMAAPLGACEKMQLIADIAAATGRPVELIDLRTVGEPLLGQILKHGQQIRGEPADLASLMQRHVYAMEDFMPYVERSYAASPDRRGGSRPTPLQIPSLPRQAQSPPCDGSLGSS